MMVSHTRKKPKTILVFGFFLVCYQKTVFVKNVVLIIVHVQQKYLYNKPSFSDL